jgi:hypothetical protein
MSDEFEHGEKERKKIVIEDRRVISEKDADGESPPKSQKKKPPKEARKGTKREPAVAAGEGEELSEEEVAASIFDLGIERFIQYNLGVIIQFAYVYMGLVANPSTGLVTQDMARAKQSIDIFEYLAEKVKGSLMPAEAEELARITKDLKLNFLNAASSRPPSAPPGGETASG